MQSSQDELDYPFAREQKIPGFSFFGVKDYMNKADNDAKKSVVSTN
jgi:hypothetical protein